MSKERNIIQVFEHDYLLLGQQGFTPKHFDALVRLNEQHGNQYFTVGYRRIKFSSFVGVVQAQGLTLEILPKADRNGTVEKWKPALLNMLKVCHGIELHSLSDAHLALRSTSLLDLYINAFIKEVEALVHKGLIKKYRKVEGNLNTLKGKLLFSEQIRRNYIHQEHFYTEHQVYDQDTLINRLLKKALIILDQINPNSFFENRLRNLLSNFELIKDIPVQEEHFFILNNLDRKTQPYQRALQLARLIILNYAPDIGAGQENTIAILFNMNKVFEAYVYLILKKTLQSGAYPNYKIQNQTRKLFWGNQGIIPDIILTLENKTKVVIDTKWKIIYDNRPADSDLKQMFAYNIHFGADTSILLYPNPHEHKPQIAHFSSSEYFKQTHRCGLCFANLFNGEGRPIPNAGRDLLEVIIQISHLKTKVQQE